MSKGVIRKQLAIKGLKAGENYIEAKISRLEKVASNTVNGK